MWFLVISAQTLGLCILIFWKACPKFLEVSQRCVFLRWISLANWYLTLHHQWIRLVYDYSSSHLATNSFFSAQRRLGLWQTYPRPCRSFHGAIAAWFRWTISTGRSFLTTINIPSRTFVYFSQKPQAVSPFASLAGHLQSLRLGGPLDSVPISNEAPYRGTWRSSF